MNKGGYIKAILRSPKSVFTFNDIVLLWGDSGTNAARVRLSYYVRNGYLNRIRRGFYAKDNSYDKLEFATRIYTPSYVSFETVLARTGITFQYYDRIFVASYQTREIICDGQTYEYKKIKSTLLTNPVGLNSKGEYSIATPERAFLDTIYLYTDYHFDNLSPLNWDKIYDLLPMYGNRRMIRRVNQFYKHFKSGNL